MLHKRTVVALLSWSCAACAHGPSAAETIPKLSAALDAEVRSESENAENSALVSEVSKSRHLEGMSRSELAQKLGAGDPCSEHPICAERGFGPDDRYFEVGRESDVYLRHRPALIVGFSRFGKVNRTYVLRVE